MTCLPQPAAFDDPIGEATGLGVIFTQCKTAFRRRDVSARYFFGARLSGGSIRDLQRL
jgi:hypothetical protein